MKKIIFFCVSLILLFLSGCQKEDEEIDLASAISGDWLTPTMYSEVYSKPCFYELRTSDSLKIYSYMLVLDGFATGLIKWPYTLDESARTITIRSIQDPDVEITYLITLTDDPDKMIWTTEQPEGETFLWERGEITHIHELVIQGSSEIVIKAEK